MKVMPMALSSPSHPRKHAADSSSSRIESRARKIPPLRGVFLRAMISFKLLKLRCNPSQSFFLDADSNTPPTPLKGGMPVFKSGLRWESR